MTNLALPLSQPDRQVADVIPAFQPGTAMRLGAILVITLGEYSG
jgi:hypothetical protein